MNYFKDLKKIKRNRGAAMMLSVVSFLFISLAIIAGLVSPSLRQFRNAAITLNSKQAYVLSESGIEDAVYRTRNNMTIGSSETITLGSNTATTTITDNGFGSKSISSTGDVSSYQRKIALSLSEGDGLSFSYGIQAGAGGFNIGTNGYIDGSIYSNGDVVGSSNAEVTGSVTVANTPASVADQSNGSGVPDYNLIFAKTDSSEDIAQSFVASSTGPLNKVEFYIKKVSTPSNATVYLTYDDDNEPDKNNDLASGTLSASLVSTSYGWVTVTFNTNPNIVSGTKYWLVISASDNNSKYYTIGANTTFSNGASKIGNYWDQDWNNNSPSNADLFFKVYLDGLVGSIDNVDIGNAGVGNAYANTVKNSSIAGINYCQTGTNNNKSCNTSLPDPSPQPMPISDQNIQDWKDDATTGGTINGNYTPGGYGISLGPKKINGDFHLDDRDVLTLTGTIWVTGNLRIDKRAIVQPSELYGGSSVAIIVDGRITISNRAEFNSNSSNSYILALTTSNCPFSPSCDGYDAIELSSRVEAVILYAANGIIDVRSRAKARQLTAYGIDLGNDSELIYDSGLINQNFIGGPSGSWNVSGWGEGQ